jgi:hypothetical protein
VSTTLFNESRKSVKLLFYNSHNGTRLENQEAKYTFTEAAEFLSQLTQPDISLITTMPSGLGLDFYSEKDGVIWIEFYGDMLQSVFVDLATARKILERAFNSTASKPVREIFSDLVSRWEY